MRTKPRITRFLLDATTDFKVFATVDGVIIRVNDKEVWFEEKVHIAWTTINKVVWSPEKVVDALVARGFSIEDKEKLVGELRSVD